MDINGYNDNLVMTNGLPLGLAFDCIRDGSGVSWCIEECPSVSLL